jgi:hypothetical protein
MQHPEHLAQPRRVLLFSGHMVDAPGRARPRFPAAQVAVAEGAISGVLDATAAGPADLALTQGAAGSDLLFAEDCLERGVRVRLMLPLAEPEFIAQSILPVQDGEAWLARWNALRRRVAPPLVRPPEAPAAPPANVFERCNLWMLDAALAHGAHKLDFICLWDGGGGDGPGGTAHMVQAARERGARVHWIDTRRLW